MQSLINAARAVIHQRDYYAEHGDYDRTTPNPATSTGQLFDDWAADILEEALETDSTTIEAVLLWPVPLIQARRNAQREAQEIV